MTCILIYYTQKLFCLHRYMEKKVMGSVFLNLTRKDFHVHAHTIEISGDRLAL